MGKRRRLKRSTSKTFGLAIPELKGVLLAIPYEGLPIAQFFIAMARSPIGRAMAAAAVTLGKRSATR